MPPVSADAFALHPQLARDTHALGDWPLCRVLLMNDAQYPWCILVPRRPGLREVYEMALADRMQLWEESDVLAKALMRAFRGDKLNLAALGNVVPQLHLHHIVRYTGDPAWPAPVWGRLPPQPYPAALLGEHVERLRQALPAGFALRSPR